MSTPRSWGRIEFPYQATADEAVRKLLEEEGVRFNEDGSLDDPLYDVEPLEEPAGIFVLSNGEARYGQFEELETALKEKGVPFDRETGMDWNTSPHRQIYRPAKDGEAEMNLYVPLNDDGVVMVSVEVIRELLAIDDAGEHAASAIRAFLDKSFPAYPPLTDWVKQDPAEKVPDWTKIPQDLLL